MLFQKQQLIQYRCADTNNYKCTVTMLTKTLNENLHETQKEHLILAGNSWLQFTHTINFL